MNFLKKLAEGDFAKGWKTLTGVLVLTFPFLLQRFGVDLNKEVLDLFYSGVVQIAGVLITLYGLYSKAVNKK